MLGGRSTSVVGIPLEGIEGNIDVVVVISTIGAAERTKEKLVFAVSAHRLRNSRGPPSPSSDRPS